MKNFFLLSHHICYLLNHTYYEEDNCGTLGDHPLSTQKSKNSREERQELKILSLPLGIYLDNL